MKHLILLTIHTLAAGITRHQALSLIRRPIFSVASYEDASRRAPAGVSMRAGRLLATFVAIFVAIVFSTDLRAAILDDLILYLPLDANATDQSAGAVATTNHNAVTFDAVGVVGGAARISNATGVNTDTASYIVTNDELSIGTSDFSVSIWVRGDSGFSVNRTDGVIIANKDWNSGLETGWVLARGTADGGGGWQWNFATTAAGRVDFDPPRTDSFFEDSRWHHLAVTHDRDASARFYFDGVAIGTRDISAHESATVDAGLPIGVGVDGARGGTWDAFINGLIDEVAIWNRVLDPSEVLAIYDGGIRGNSISNLADPLRLTLEVHRETGELILRNTTTADIDLQGYSIFSADGALVPMEWTSISQFGDADSGGTVDSDNRWVEFTDNTTFRDLSEGALGVGTLAAGQSFSLGVGSWLQYHAEELTFEYIDGAGNVRSDAAIDYIGNSGSPFPLGDLNFDGQLDRNDWLVFADGLGSKLSGTTLAQAYRHGDLNGDYVSDHADFLDFQIAYDLANGPGAFMAMVPEPANGTLALLSIIFLSASRNRFRLASRPSCRIALAISLALFAAGEGMAQVVLLAEDFESLATELRPFESPTESGGDGTDWTDQPPVGWLVDNTQMSANGVQEFNGWTFLDRDAWIRTANDQQRSQFINASGVVAVADPDEWQDNGAAGFFNSFLQSPEIPLVGVEPGTVTVEFDSSWRDEDAQTALLHASFDGGPDVEIVRWESVVGSPLFKDDATNERVRLSIIHPDDTNSMVLKWGVVDAGNDWWWAIDNLRVESVDRELALKLEVNTASGMVQIRNDTEAVIDFNYYQIDSPTGSLRVDRWHSLADQGIDSLGQKPGDRWTEGGGSDAARLVEAFLLGSTTLDVAQSLSLGRAYDHAQAANDLQFSYGTVDGNLHTGIVRYVEGHLICDFDADGDCDLVDIDALFATGDLTVGVAIADSVFDLNADGVLDSDDVDQWLAEAGIERGFDDSAVRGDSNLDGAVDAFDLNRLGIHWLQSNRVWSDGDFNGDGLVDSADLNLVGVHWLMNVNPIPMASVPEPIANVFWFMAFVGFYCTRRG